MVARRTLKNMVESTAPTGRPTAALRPAGEQALDAASWERLRRVIEGLAALSTSTDAPSPAGRTARKR